MDTFSPLAIGSGASLTGPPTQTDCPSTAGALTKFSGESWTTDWSGEERLALVLSDKNGFGANAARFLVRAAIAQRLHMQNNPYRHGRYSKESQAIVKQSGFFLAYVNKMCLGFFILLEGSICYRRPSSASFTSKCVLTVRRFVMAMEKPPKVLHVTRGLGLLSTSFFCFFYVQISFDS